MDMIDSSVHLPAPIRPSRAAAALRAWFAAVGLAALAGCCCYSYSITISFASDPLLTPASPSAGLTFVITYHMVNDSGAAATDVHWRVSRDGVANYASGKVDYLGGHAGVDIPVTVTGETAGSHTYVIEVDPADHVGDGQSAAVVVVAPDAAG